MRERTLALAGLAQAIEAVLQTAHEGHADEKLLEPALDSIFAIDAASTEAVYGGAKRLRSGLQLLLAQLEGSGTKRANSNRIAFTVMQVERKLIQQPALLQKISEGIERSRPDHTRSGSLDPEVQQALGDLYSATVSSLTPRVLVQGDPNQLAQSAVVGRIRASLLAAVRAAVLWRQVGGSWWDLLLRRGAIARCTRELLAEMES
jgi:high frequency lysogenization protein